MSAAVFKGLAQRGNPHCKCIIVEPVGAIALGLEALEAIQR